MRLGVGVGVSARRRSFAAAPPVAIPVKVSGPSFKRLDVIEGDVISTASFNAGTYTNSPSSVVQTFKLDAVTKTMPYTVLAADAGKIPTVTEVPSNAGGAGLPAVSPPAQAVLAAAPSGSIWISRYDPAIHNPVNRGSDPRWPSAGPYFWDGTRRLYLDSAYNAGQVVSLDNKVVRYTVASVDVMNTVGYYSDSAGTNRNTLTERTTDAYSNTTEQFLELAITVPVGAPLDHTWCSLWEAHVYGPSIAQMMELIILANGRFASTAHYRNGSTDTTRNSGPATFTDASPLTRGQRYVFGLWVRPHATTGRIVIVKDGVQVVNFTGAVGYGATTTSWRNQRGIYRGGASNALSVDIEVLQQVTGAAGTLTFPDPPARSYGANLIGTTFTNADAGTFVISGADRVATSGGSIGPTNIPGGYVTLSGLTPDDRYESSGGTRRGTMTSARNTVLNNDGSFAQLGDFTTANTTETDYTFDVLIPASGTIRVYFGGQASASGQIAYHNIAKMKFRKVL